MSRLKRKPSRTWVSDIFNSSAVARSGGPVRRSLASIRKNASPARVIREAKARSWLIYKVGPYWLFHAEYLAHGPVVKRPAPFPRIPRSRRGRTKACLAASLSRHASTIQDARERVSA